MIVRIRTAALAATLALAAPALRAEVTFTKDVEPILQQNCQNCHRPGEAVPFNLTSYEETRPWAKAIRKAVSERTMPPWHADRSVGKWLNDPSLDQADIDTVVRWVDSGAPMGDPADSPPPREFLQGWKIGEPDLVLHFEEEEVLPAELEDEYRYVTLKTGFTEDRWVKAIECRPGNIEVVHHIIAFAKPSGMSMGGGDRPARGEGGDRRKGRRGPASGGGGDNGFSALGGFAPGTEPHFMPPGEAILIPAGSDIVFQMHYHKEPGTVERDSSYVGLRFADYVVTRRHRGDAVGNLLFRIPAGAENHEVRASMKLDREIELKTVMPHMHLRGTDMKVWARLPDGTERDLIMVPKYDFDWQHIYQFADRPLLPAGTTLHAVAHYDNSANNPHNPDPTEDVRFGHPTTAEMMFAFLSYTWPGEQLSATDPSYRPLLGGGGR